MPVLTGHHRNYSPVMAKAREIVRSGRLGPIVAVVGTALFYKPDDYFDAGGGWRRQPGGGPILLNLIHEVNNLLSLVGRHRVGAGRDVERGPGLPRRGHGGHGVHLRERRAGHVPAVRRRGLGPVVGADLAGERQLRDLSRRGLLPHRRHPRVAVGPDHAAQDLPRHAGPGGSPSTRRRSRSSGATRSPTRSRTSRRSSGARAEPICSGRDGLATLKVVDAVVEAARTKRPVDVAT